MAHNGAANPNCRFAALRPPPYSHGHTLRRLPPHSYTHARDRRRCPPDETIRVNTDLVSVPVIITDRRARRIAGLTAADFEIIDEGRGVEISYFAAGAERVALVFLLDASGSTRDIIAGQREAALALFSRFGKRSRVSVIHFQERPALSLPFTADPEAARAAFRFVAYQTAARPSSTPPSPPSAPSTPPAPTAERRIVILISDGLDTASRVRPSAVIDEARARNVTFYVIHTPLFWIQGGRLSPRPTAKGFRDLAQKTGGQLFVVGDAETSSGAPTPHDFWPVFRAIEDDLRGQYVLGYYAGDAERTGRPRRVEVRQFAGAQTPRARAPHTYVSNAGPKAAASPRAPPER